MDLLPGWRDTSKYVMTISNLLLDALPIGTQRRLLSSCDTVELEFNTRLSEACSTMRFAYFPLTSFVSLVTVLEEHRPLEVGLIGNEGMLGATVALGTSTSPLTTIVQGAGSALRVKICVLRKEIESDKALANLLKRYLFVGMVQLAQASGCLRFHSVEERLARWLLMTHDRSHADRFYLTHSFLADMLGVRRSAVTIAAGKLQQRRVISYSRGDIKVLSRRGLESTSCACYEASQLTHSRWLG
jgi:CRP-like cAMP-binding protein